MVDLMVRLGMTSSLMFNFSSFFCLLLYLLAFAPSCGDDPYRNYQEVKNASKQTQRSVYPKNKTYSSTKLIPIRDNFPKSLSYDVPADWKEAPAGKMVIKFFKLKSGSEVTLSAFAGDVGGLIANINRWARQINLFDRNKIHQVIDGLNQNQGKYPYVLINFLDVTSGSTQSIVAGVFQFQDKTLFVKLSGRSNDLESEKVEFLSFLGSLR